MSPPTDATDHETLTPDDAFSILGNEIRIQILQELGKANQPLSFTDLRQRVGVRQGAQFNYHLDKLVGHFVEKTDNGYRLRQPGRRVIQSVLSGAVTDDPVLQPTEVDFPCRHCGASVEVSYGRGQLWLSCTACGGNYDESADSFGGRFHERDDGNGSANLSSVPLPPAGIQGRTAAEALRAAATTGHLDAMAASSNVCPRCSAPVDYSVNVCESHDESSGLCEECGFRLAVRVQFRCINCIYEQGFSAVMTLLNIPELLVFVGEHGLNTSSRGIEWGWDYQEEVISVDPFKGQFTFTIQDDSITLTIDDTLSVINMTKNYGSDSTL